MGLYNDQLLPRVIDRVLDTGEARKHRSHVVPAASGVVLEFGFGSGTNLPFYGEAVERVLAVDPATVGRKLDRINRFPRPVEFIGLDGQRLSIEDDSVDTVVSTWTLCTIADAHAALLEARRVLRPGGRLLYVEHGRHPDAATAATQRRIEPLWRRIAGGCHLTRHAPSLVEAAGFRHTSNTEHMMKQSPGAFGYLFEGIATPV
jgi:ubiquinone/menaquinone biosynthesis C-methylase UbiE